MELKPALIKANAIPRRVPDLSILGNCGCKALSWSPEPLNAGCIFTVAFNACSNGSARPQHAEEVAENRISNA